jgi:hypothetical protein
LLSVVVEAVVVDCKSRNPNIESKCTRWMSDFLKKAKEKVTGASTSGAQAVAK